MTLQQTEYQQALSNFMSELSDNFDYAITLTVKNLKQQSYYSAKNGKTITHAKVADIANTFVHKLNQNLLKRCYRKRTKKFNSLIKIEPNKLDDNKHIHIAIGKCTFTKDDVEQALLNIIKHTDALDAQYAIEKIYDKGWLNYISKRQHTNSDSVLFETSVVNYTKQ